MHVLHHPHYRALQLLTHLQGDSVWEEREERPVDRRDGLIHTARAITLPLGPPALTCRSALSSCLSSASSAFMDSRCFFSASLLPREGVKVHVSSPRVGGPFDPSCP